MKKAFFLLLILATGLSVSAQDMYLEYKMSGPLTGITRMYTSTSGVRTEADMNMPAVGPIKNVVIMPASKPNTVITINDKAKTYTETTTKPSDVPAMRYEVKVVGKEKIKQYDCVHAVVTVDGKLAMEMWTSKDIPGYESLIKLAKTSNTVGSEGLYKQLESKGAMGMMVKMKTNAGANSLMTELVKVERRANPARLFAVPAGYSKSAEFDPGQIKNMTPAQRQKLMEEMQKKYSKP
ncbi:MAG: DUF4412 domain-containing protein [Cytophagaceae bacterium]|nr:DUF4412 domain-containing protein [Cytophagaceae bacterium]